MIMDTLLKNLINASGVSGAEHEVAALMKAELAKYCSRVEIDAMGNVIGVKGAGAKKIMLAAHMDEVGLLVKHVTAEGFLKFIKIGGIDDRVLAGQRVVVKTKSGDLNGVIGIKPPHLMKEEEKKQPFKYEDMFIDAGFSSRDEALKKVSLGDSGVFEPNAGELAGGLLFGKAVDDRIGCYALIKIMERVKVNAQVFAVATVQEEVGLKGARTAAFKINPDYAIAIDTTLAGDTPQIKETESSLKLGGGAAITIMEAAGRGIIVSEKMREICLEEARKNNIKHQVDILEGGMTDAAMIYINREGIPTAVLSVPARYIHAPTGVFNFDDVNATIELTIKVIERLAKE